MVLIYCFFFLPPGGRMDSGITSSLIMHTLNGGGCLISWMNAHTHNSSLTILSFSLPISIQARRSDRSSTGRHWRWHQQSLLPAVQQHDPNIKDYARHSLRGLRWRSPQVCTSTKGRALEHTCRTESQTVLNLVHGDSGLSDPLCKEKHLDS